MMHHTYLRYLELRRGGLLAPDTGADGGAPDGPGGPQDGANGAGGKNPAQAQQNGQKAPQSAPEGENGERLFSQAEVNEMMARERAKAERARQRAVSDAVTEAKRLAQMTEDERRKEEERLREEDYQRRLAELNRRELEAQVRQTLAEKGIPDHYAQFIHMGSADEANESIEALSKLWRSDMDKARAAKAAEMVGGSAGAPTAGRAGAPASLREAVAAYYDARR